ncbi:GGDEF domain-containing protein [Alkalicoccus saliphilus]|uniref:GGDEF domain-containing protein n=1 Tax=Alkalicoccus saliphilus TaxID=200989 RepID=A0A2T4U4H1_9BACI|nr:diguanylate cyclase [Alkalicoccus saliphilus]PTL38297.1 GGDEF domain-containing protein [Alkalicoccus saliphilus]
MIFKELISNLAILMACLFLYTHFTKSSVLYNTVSLRLKLFMGIMAGLLSNLLMQYSMEFGETMVDLRHIPVLLTAYYGGAIPALITMGLIISGRFLISVSVSSVTAMLLIAAVTISALLVNKLPTRKSRITAMLTSSNIIFTVVILYLLQDVQTLLFLVPLFWGISYLAGAVAFYTIESTREMQILVKRYREDSLTDSLTGLHNVRQFDEKYNFLTNEAEKNKENLSLLYIDIDYFKNINDTFGHKEGDVVLQQLGTLIQHNVREKDIVSRNGGEEFTVMLPDTTLEEAYTTAERVRAAVEKNSFELETGKTIHITVSIGAASHPETSPAHELIAEADKALYAAKSNGRNQVVTAGDYGTLELQMN